MKREAFATQKLGSSRLGVLGHTYVFLVEEKDRFPMQFIKHELGELSSGEVAR